MGSPGGISSRAGKGTSRAVKHLHPRPSGWPASARGSHTWPHRPCGTFVDAYAAVTNKVHVSGTETAQVYSLFTSCCPDLLIQDINVGHGRPPGTRFSQQKSNRGTVPQAPRGCGVRHLRRPPRPGPRPSVPVNTFFSLRLRGCQNGAVSFTAGATCVCNGCLHGLMLCSLVNEQMFLKKVSETQQNFDTTNL